MKPFFQSLIALGVAAAAVAVPLTASEKAAEKASVKADFLDRKSVSELSEVKPGSKKAVKSHAVSGIPSTKVYAWLTRDSKIAKGIVSFNLNEPENVTSEFTLPNLAYAGCYANGKYYFDRYKNTSDSWEHIAFSSVDLKTGAVTDIKNWSDEYFVVNDMTYDYSTGTIYAMVSNIYIDDFLPGFYTQYSGIWTINPNTGVPTEIKQFIDWENGTLGNVTYYTIASDINGTLYAIDSAGYLVKFDKDNDFAEVEIGYTGISDLNHTTQSMEFDHSTGMIYWCADHSKSASELVVIDPVSAKGSVVGKTGNDSHLVGLYIPFDAPSGAAPAAVTNFTAVPDATGANKIALSWTNPTSSFGGATLYTISNVKVYRDGEELATLTGATPGSAMQWEDTTVAEPGNYTYSVVASNSAGKGMIAGLTRWVGLDVPAAVGNLGIGKTDEGYAYLEWEAPSEGAHKGVIDSSSLGYKIIRFPDATIIASDLKDTSFTDTTVPGIGRYYYTVEPHTAQGAGDAKNTVEIAIGSGIEEYPWSTLFKDLSEFNLWTVVDVNGGSTWSWKSRTASGYTSFAMYGYDNNRSGDDYLISPDLLMKKGGRYKVKFAYSGSNTTYTENLEFTFGKGKTAEAQSNVLAQYTMKDGTVRFAEVELPEIEETGNYNFAFHAVSEKGQYNIYITDVTVSMTVAPPDDDDEKEDDTFDFKAPYNLEVTIDKNDVTLTWNEASDNPGGSTDTPATANIFEDFESMPKWAINPEGSYGWNYIDGDKGIPYVSDYDVMPYPTDGEPLAAMVMAPYDLGEYVYLPNPPHSGNQYLLFKSNFYDANRQRPAPAPDDWFISPELNFDQDFVFRFYCKADPDAEAKEDNDYGYTWDPWDTEEFRVGFSTTGKEPEDFVWMTNGNERVQTNFDEWLKKEYSIPKEAKYVCIRYCTPDNGYWFMVDDVFIGIENNSLRAPRKADALFYYYEVSIDDVVIGNTQETSFTITNVDKGTHVAKVRAIYKQGVSEPAIAAFNITETSGIETLGGENADAVYYDINGRRVDNPLPGSLLIKVVNGNAEKVIVK